MKGGAAESCIFLGYLFWKTLTICWPVNVHFALIRL